MFRPIFSNVYFFSIFKLKFNSYELTQLFINLFYISYYYLFYSKLYSFKYLYTLTNYYMHILL
jgi:hypothetical protein